jgi:HEPN domain-containing protein
MSADEEKVKYTREWLRTATDDLEAVARLLQPPQLSALAAFHCQQAVEKAIKGYLMWHETPFRKTHNLVELVEQCSEVDPTFSELKTAAETLTPYATESRYPDTELDLSSEALAEAERLAAETVVFIRKRLSPEVHP